MSTQILPDGSTPNTYVNGPPQQVLSDGDRQYADIVQLGGFLADRTGEAVPVGWSFDCHGVLPMDEIEAGRWAGYTLDELWAIWGHAYRN